MTDVITASARTLEHRDIDADFEHLREIMTGWSFRKSTGLGGEQPYYISITLRPKSLRCKSTYQRW